VGLGYVGLPLAVAFAEEGHEVVGLDPDPRKGGALAEHSSYVENVPSERLAALVLEFRGVTRDIEAANLVRLLRAPRRRSSSLRSS
jgi:UDP-N-acetyl-D-mannosaminuronate dehydrogenase